MTRTAPWPAHPLGELVDVMDGRRVPVNAEERARRPGQVPYYGAAGQVGWIDQPLFDEDLLLLGEDGVQFFDPTKSKAYRITGPSWVNNHAHVLRARGAVDWRYLEHYLNWFDYRGFANGTTRLKLTQAAMKRIPVALPELDEQRRIVDILEDHLSRLDAANDYLDAAARRSKRAVQAALEALWTASARSGSWMRVEDLGKVVTGSTPKDGASAFGGATPFVTPGDVGYGERVTSWQRTLSDAGAVSSRLLPAGSVLAVCIGATLGKVGWTSVAAATNQQINGVVINLDDVDAAYVAALMAAPGFQDQMRTSASSTTMPILNKSKFSALSLPVATGRAAQSQWERYMRARDASERVGNAVEASGRRGVKLRRAVLRAAFNGSLTGTIAVTSRPVLSESSHV